MRAGSESNLTSRAFIDYEAALRMAAGADALQAASNKITVENAKLGNPPSEWMIDGIGDDNIVGFATDISVNRGQTVSFKIRTNSLNYRIDIYRLGYYGGNGARKVTAIQRQLATAQIQPNPGGDPTIGLVDCGNWAVSATWTVPSAEVTGLYIAKLVRQDATPGVNHIPFVVRDDGVASDLLFQTSDTTWCAYNSWGGYSLYGGDLPAFRAYKVSYNRPYNTRGYDFQSGPQDWIFGVEYPMIRWLERNGYDVSYSTGVDSDRRGGEILLHKIFLSVGHDEYWSGPQRANVEAARDAGVNLAFFSGNECYWKTRWESSVAGPATPYRTLVCYKESRANAKIDPSPTWTGTWRDPRFSPPSDGGRPENALTGTIFQVDSYRLDTIKVPYEHSRFRFWRNTSFAGLPSGQTGSLVKNYLGYEWDEDRDNGFRPGGLIDLSQTARNVTTYLRDYGSTIGAATATHSLTLYRAPNGGGLVFGAGTVYWAWGLDSNHDNEATPVDLNVQQATVNLLADMGVQPATPQADVVVTPASSDVTPPVSTITSPAVGARAREGQRVVVRGTASDVGGVVAGVEVSMDNGVTWNKASGRASWTFAWNAQAPGSYVIRSRATDDSCNTETPSAGRTLTVLAPTTESLWTYADAPTNPFVEDTTPVELGLRFVPAVSGKVTGVRFYKGDLNVGVHTARLWTAAGASLGSATFANETLRGWQQVLFATPIDVTAGTPYVVSYHTDAFYSADPGYFGVPRVRGNLTAPASAPAALNGVFAYGPAGTFPDSSFDGTNYWVDLTFAAGPPAPPIDGETLFPDTATPAVVTENDTTPVELGVRFRASVAGAITGIRFYKGPSNVGPHEGRLWSAAGAQLAMVTFTSETGSGWQTVLFATPITITAGTTYVASYHTAGFYSADANYFATARVSGSLTAPADAPGAANGVYQYGPSGTFPTQTFSKTNYWVDVVFKPTTA
ncbi:hypothetical protein METY_1272 [Methylopila sp. Yamaguchi]|nr:hypothetical protein METY_1272 [Methylopila sp. Yamaguchi]